MQVIHWTLRLSLIVMPLVMLPDTFRSSFGAKAFVLSFVVLLLAIGWVAARDLQFLRSVSFGLPLLVFFIFHLMQVTRSVNPDVGIHLLLLQLGCGFIATSTIVSRDEVVSLIRYMAAGGLAVAVVGVCEYWGLSGAMLPSAGRPSATFGFRNIAALYLAVALPVSLALIFERLPRDRLLGYASVTLMSIFLVYTRTRGAWVGVFFALFAGLVVVGICGFANVLWQRMWHDRIGAGSAVLVCIFLMFLPPNYSDQSLSRVDETKQDLEKTVVSIVEASGDRRRLDVWQHTLEIIADHAIVGAGLGNWTVLYPRYDRGDVAGIVVSPRRPHNDFLWYWSELGTGGLLVYLWLIVAIFRQLWKTVGSQGIEALPMLCAGVGALAVLIHSCFSFPREQAVVLLPLWIALGIAGRQYQGVKQHKTKGLQLALAGIGLVIGVWGCMTHYSLMRFDYYFTQSLIAQAAGRSEEQVLMAQEARISGLFDHRILLLEGEGLRQQGDAQGTVSVYQTYLLYQPFLPAVHNNLGRAYEALDQLDLAQESYLNGLATFSGDGAYLLQNNLAVVYKKQGQVTKALALYEGMPSKSADVYHNMGLIYTEQEKLETAKEAYEMALAHDSEMTIALFSLAGVEMLRGNMEEAAKHYEAFLSQWAGAQDYVRDAHLRLRQIYPVLSDRYLKNRKTTRAAFVLERLIALGEQTPDVYTNLALLYGQMGKHNEAIENVKAAIALSPHFERAHFMLAIAYDALGQTRAAVKHYRDFLVLNPQNQQMANQARLRLNTLAK